MNLSPQIIASLLGTTVGLVAIASGAYYSTISPWLFPLFSIFGLVVITVPFIWNLRTEKNRLPTTLFIIAVVLVGLSIAMNSLNCSSRCGIDEEYRNRLEQKELELEQEVLEYESRVNNSI